MAGSQPEAGGAAVVQRRHPILNGRRTPMIYVVTYLQGGLLEDIRVTDDLETAKRWEEEIALLNGIEKDEEGRYFSFEEEVLIREIPPADIKLSTQPTERFTKADLLRIASAGYDEHEPDDLHRYFDQDTGEPFEDLDDIGDGLARFVVVELASTFEEGLDKEYLLHQALDYISSALLQLQGVQSALFHAWSEVTEVP